MAFRPCLVAGAILILACNAEDINSCAAEDASCASKGSPAPSLLQKDFRRHEGTLDEEQSPRAAPCTGVAMQGRCWHLSELGENCGQTCTKYGRSFLYVVADINDPVTPRLVGHIPSAKQQPWAALECYVPSEDRYHPANANAAKHSVEESGTWSYAECKLACPCGPANGLQPPSPTPAIQPPSPTPPIVDPEAKCTWKQSPNCVPEYMYKGLAYHGCATVDSQHERPWCQHVFEHVDGPVQDWSYCAYTCGDDAPAPSPTPIQPPQDVPQPPQENCRWVPAFSCVGEFDYEGTHYVGCTRADHDTPWCSNANPYTGSWNHCVYSCDNQDGVVPPQSQDDTMCRWEMKPECSKTFRYKGMDYATCTTEDHPTPWCSLDRVHKGSWTTCTKVCNEASGHVLPPADPTPVVPTSPPMPANDPCARNAQTENDILGQSVTLDEAGYKIAASADSPINMKRFICRVVDKIECRVTDYSSLMAFVPYYSGLVSHQTYAHLQNELVTLCHAGGKWVSPK